MESIPVVRIIVVNRHGQALILQRAINSTAGGRWCLPGGKIDPGESVAAAAKRELQEETGIVADSLTLISCTPGKHPYIHHHVECCSDSDPTLNDESTAYAWIGQDDLLKVDMAFGDDQALLRYWARNSLH